MWGLSSYLIVEKGYRAGEVKESALEWLQFIFPDYYVYEELVNLGTDPAAFGLENDSACYSGRCELPFREGGCGGMGKLEL